MKIFKMKSKKGSLADFFIIPAFLLLIGLVVFVTLIMINKVSDTGVFDSNAVASNAITKAKTTFSMFDNLMIFIIVGLSLYVLVSSAVVMNHPAFFILGFVLLVIAITFSAIVSNSYWDITQDSNIASVSQNYPKLNYLMNHLPYYIVFMGMATITLMFIGYLKT